MSTIPADVSIIAKSAPAASSVSRRLPRLMGWGLAAVISGGLWFAIGALIRLAF